MTAERESAIPVSELDRGTRERLERLMGSDPAGITAGDRAFLEARKDYLTAAQRKDFGIGKGKGGNNDGGNAGDRYDAMNGEALKKEAKKRGLAVGGKVEELRARLREDDAKPKE